MRYYRPFFICRPLRVLKQLALIVFLALASKCSGQDNYDPSKISQQTASNVAAIEKINELMGAAVYYEGITPSQYQNFDKLRNEATSEELLELTDHPNGVVRCYAFWGLAYDTVVNLFPIAARHIGDTVMIKTQFGCIGSQEKVGDFFMRMAAPSHADSSWKKNFASELAYLDSLLIFVPNTLNAREDAVSRAAMTDNVYTRIRTIVAEEHYRPALVKLAMFKKEQDTQLILDNGLYEETNEPSVYTYRAICEFPHPSFWPLLNKELLELLGEQKYLSNEQAEMYHSIASYKSDVALQLLKMPFIEVKDKDKYRRSSHMHVIFDAVQKYYVPIYNDLLWELWENENKISTDVLYLLYTKDPEKAYQLTRKTLQNLSDFDYLINTYTEGGVTYKGLLDVMLDTLSAHDKSFVVELINRHIRESDVHQFPVFADRAIMLRDLSLIESLFDRLNKEENPHVYLKAAEVLIAFGDEKINKRIVAISKRNRNMLRGWGGKEFAELLKNNNIR